jgi:hypothetical protein
MRVNMSPEQSTVNQGPVQRPRKGTVELPMIDALVAALAAAFMILAPLAALAYLALTFGVDTRPGIDDDDRRPWLVPSR